MAQLLFVSLEEFYPASSGLKLLATGGYKLEWGQTSQRREVAQTIADCWPIREYRHIRLTASRA